MSPFLRHIAACNDAVLPGGRLAFRLAETRVGWVRPDFAAVLADLPGIIADADCVTLADPAALPALARALADRGLFRHRGEAFDVRAVPGGQVLSTIDRGALPAFGVMAEGIHGNGLVRRADGLQVWVARRAADKALDPGKLDHIVAGGMPAGFTPSETLVKEAAEEAAIPAALAEAARPVATIAYAMDRPEGLRRDILHCYDIDLPESFVPHAADGEVESFALWPIARVLEAVRDGEDFKFNVNLVLIDLFLREGLLAGGDAAALRAALTPP
jgi:8-oxo-dGTP pyrophosphatase MutT (NUDIX family)